jgi:hypothetical protein
LTPYTLTPDPQEPLDIDVAVVVLPETREARQKRLAKARAAYDQALKRVAEKAHLLAEEATAPNKRALTGAQNAFAKAQARLEEERVAKPFTTLCYTINPVSPWSLKRIYSTYRGRFGIESSYRQSRQARIFTTSRKPWFRFLIFGLSLILRNLWLEVRWLLGEPKRGRGGWSRRPGRPYVSEPGFTLKLRCQTHCGGFRELLRLKTFLGFVVL